MKSVKNIVKNRIFKNNRGTTLVEMIVCFALMGIFMAAAAAIISSITGLYYNIKGEIYSREVSDIVMEKITSEIDGAEYYATEKPNSSNPVVADNHKNIDLFDKTGTHVMVGLDDVGKFRIYYYPIEVSVNGEKDYKYSRDETSWYFDEKMYNGFRLEDLSIYSCGESASILDSELASKCGIAGTDLKAYDGNVVLVLMKLNSGRYGEYYYYKYIRLYNLPKDYPWLSESNP